MCHRIHKLALAMTCVMALIVGLAQNAPGKSITSPENIASGEFFEDPVSLRQEMPPEPLRMQQGEWSSRMKTVSGRRVWLSPDPIKEDGGLNLYGYVYGNPINMWDPNGLWPDGLLTPGEALGAYYQGAAVVVDAFVDTAIEGSKAVVPVGMFIPAVDDAYDSIKSPLNKLGAYDKCDDNLKYSHTAAKVSAGAALLATGGAGSKTADGLVTVTRWGRSGLKGGDWVMQGGRNWWNYLRSGKYQPKSWPGGNCPAPFKAGQSFRVPKGSVQLPKAEGIWGKIKGLLLGQRQYFP